MRKEQRLIDEQVEKLKCEIQSLQRLVPKDNENSITAMLSAPKIQSDPFGIKVEQKIKLIQGKIDKIQRDGKDVTRKCNDIEDLCKGYIGYIEQIEYLRSMK